MRGAAGLLSLILVTGGCLGGDAGDEAPTTPPSGRPAGGPAGAGAGQSGGLPAEPAVAPVPEWHVGQAWTYAATYRFGVQTEVTLVVTAVEGGAYIVGATDAKAGQYALVAHWPPIGPVRASDLANLIHGETVAPIQWPLTDGKSWTSTVRGESVAFTATEQNSTGHATFRIVGRAGEATRFDVVYDPAVGWFSHFQYWFPGETDASHVYDLKSSSTDFKGGVVRFDWADAYVGHRLPPAPPAAPDPPTDQFTVAGGATYLLVALFHGGGPGVVRADMVGPMGEHAEAGGPRSVEEDVTLALTTLPATPGQWAVTYTATAQQYAVFAEAVEVTETSVSVQPA